MKLREHYEKNVVAELQKQFNYSNKFQVPRVEKVVINMGIGEAAASPKPLMVA